MKYSLPVSFGLVFAMLLLSACDKSYQDDSKALVEVSGETITENAYQHYRKVLQAQQQAAIQDNEQNRSLLLEQMVFNRLMIQEAQNQKLQLDSEIHYSIQLRREEILIGAVARNYLESNPVKKEDITARYAKLKKSHEYQARHILVDNQKLATEIISKLKKKKSYAALAKKYSTHEQSKAKAGKLGWINREFIAPSVFEAADQLKKPGLIEKPVQSSFGWHVVKVDKVRSAKVPPLDSIKQTIIGQLQREKISELGRYLRKGGKVEYLGKND